MTGERTTWMMPVAIALVCVLLSNAYAQRTLMRTCDCEYTMDGRCAYTLLLPSTNPEQPACPQNADVTTTAQAATGPTTEDEWAIIESLRISVADLSASTSQLARHSGDQARMLSQLQSKVLAHSDDLDKLEHQLAILASQANMTAQSSNNESEFDGCEGCEGLQAVVDENTARVEALNQSMGEINRMVGEMRVALENILEQLNSATDGVLNATIDGNDTEARLEEMSEKIESVQANLAVFQLCSKKGILVSGDRARIEDEAIEASVANENATFVRIRDTDIPSAWCTGEQQEDSNTDSEWIQFDLGQPRNLYGVVTKGHADFPQWVTSFRLEYSLDSDLNMTSYTDLLGDKQIFAGNEDKSTLKTNLFFQPIRARFVRFLPISGYEGRKKCLRADVIGCLD